MAFGAIYAGAYLLSQPVLYCLQLLCLCCLQAVKLVLGVCKQLRYVLQLAPELMVLLHQPLVVLQDLDTLGAVALNLLLDSLYSHNMQLAIMSLLEYPVHMRVATVKS